VKILSDSQVITLIEGASDSAILAAQAAIPKSSRDLTDDWLAYGVKEGFYKTATLELDQVPVATIFYSMDGRTLRINACHALVKDRDLDAAFECAFRRLAGDRNALRVQFETKRGGAIRKAIKNGYEISGVILRRTITGVSTVEVVEDHAHPEQRNLSGPSESKQDETEQQTSTDNEVAAQNGGIALGQGDTGNTVSVTTDDVNAINANTQVTGESLEAGVEETQTSLAAGIAGLQAASSLAQSGLAASTDVSDTAIASNNQVTNEALGTGEEETHDALEAAQGTTAAAVALGQSGLSEGMDLGESGLAAGVSLAAGVESTSTDDLDAALESNAATTQAADTLSGGVVSDAISAVLTGQANSSALIQSVVNSNTAALENSNTLAYETAAGAVSQTGQTAGAAIDASYGQPVQDVGGFSVSPQTSSGPLVLIGVAALALVGLLILFKE
jgi:hypothetical protein